MTRQLLVVLLTAASLALAPVAHAQSNKSKEPAASKLTPEQKEAGRAAALKLSAEALEKLYKLQPDARNTVESAAGYAVFDITSIYAILFVGQKGKGVLIDNKTKKTTYMTSTRMGTGPGAGKQRVFQIFVFKSKGAMDQFLLTGGLGGDVSATVSTGTDGSVRSFNPDIDVIQIPESGMAVQASWGGTVYAVDSDLNENGRPASLARLSNPHERGCAIVSAFAVSLLVLACAFGGALFGIGLRAALPEHHLSTESKDIVKLGTGLVGTMVALVLGLLIASAKGSYDTQSAELTQMSANIYVLDRALGMYGPETKLARAELHGYAAGILDHMWPKDGPGDSRTAAPSGGEILYEKLQELAPKNDFQRSLHGQLLGIAVDVGRTRSLMYAQGAGSISMPLLVMLILWITFIFISFGLFAPFNATVVASLFAAAFSVSGAIFLILEMYSPYSGLIQISSAPLRAVLDTMGR